MVFFRVFRVFRGFSLYFSQACFAPAFFSLIRYRLVSTVT